MELRKKIMREIKVRAWDKKKKVMYPGIALKKLLAYLVFQDSPNSEAYTAMKDHFEDIEWLEYTGLKDKSGVEMYEGDILKYKHVVLEIIWNTAFAKWEAKNHTDREHETLSVWNIKEKFEVIGNIHQHKDLLND